jgi:RNA polymerase sigma-70 factor (ECF subfamily)
MLPSRAVGSAISPEEIQRLFADGTARRPRVRATLQRFADAMEARVAAGAALSEVFAADLLLATGCLEGDEGSLETFEIECMQDASKALARLRLDASATDEILQRVRTKLLVGDGGAPRLATYAARGSLAGWVRAAVVHEALSTKRAEVRRGPHTGASALERLHGLDDPDLARLHAAYAVPFKEAFTAVLGSLAPRDRNVLRLVYVDGLTAEQVGAAYGVHRVSVARWIGQIRAALFERTRARLCERLQLSPAEMESMTRLCLSQIDVSLDRLLLESA